MFVGIARFYGPVAFGQFTTAHTFSTVFLLFADFGFDTLLATEIARQRDNAAKLAQQYFSLKIFFVLLATAAMAIASTFQSVGESTRMLMLVFSLYVLFSSLNNFFFALFKGFEQFQHETKISFGINLFLFVLLIVFGFINAPLYVIAVSFVGTRVIGLLVGAKIAARLTQFRFLAFDLTDWKRLFNRVSIFGFQFIFGNLFFTMDTLLLAFWKSDRDVGIYQAVFKLAILILIVPEIATSTLMPVLSRFHDENEARWNSLGRLLNKTLFLLGLPICMMLFVYADQIIAIVYGRGTFVDSVLILRMFAFIVFVRFSVETFALMLTTSRRQQVRMWIVVGGTIINFGMNIFFIPRFGPYGAALVSLITNIIVGIGYIIAARSSLTQWMLNVRSLIPLIVVSMMTLVVWNIRTVSLWYTCPIAFIVYGLVIYSIGYSREEWKMIFVRDKYVSMA